jgi:hypothetical protein
MNIDQIKAEMKNHLLLGDIPEALDMFIQNDVSKSEAKRLKTKWLNAKKEKANRILTSQKFNQIEQEIGREIQKMVDAFDRNDAGQNGFSLAGITKYARPIGIAAALALAAVIWSNIASRPGAAEQKGIILTEQTAESLFAPSTDPATGDTLLKQPDGPAANPFQTPNPNTGAAAAKPAPKTARTETPGADAKDPAPAAPMDDIKVEPLRGTPAPEEPAPRIAAPAEVKTPSPDVAAQTEAPKRNKPIYLNIGSDFKQASIEGNYKIVSGDVGTTKPDIVFSDDKNCEVDVEKVKKKVEAGREVLIWMSGPTIQKMNNAAFAASIKNKWNIDVNFDNKSKKGFLTE